MDPIDFSMFGLPSELNLDARGDVNVETYIGGAGEDDLPQNKIIAAMDKKHRG